MDLIGRIRETGQMVDHPTAARRRLRLALRQLREQKALTQGQVAGAMEWSLSKVMRIENGSVSVSVNDIQALLAFYQLRDPHEVEALLEVGREARQGRRRTTYGPDRAVAELASFASAATAVRIFDAVLMPGLLQTHDYAEAITGAVVAPFPDERVEPSSGGIRVVLDEAVLHRVVGGPVVMAEQLGHLLGMMREARMDVRVLPFDTAVIAAAASPAYCVIELASPDDQVIYRLHPTRLASVADDIEEATKNFEPVWEQAAGYEETVDIVSGQVAAFLRQAARTRRPFQV